MLQADPGKVSSRDKKRGLTQVSGKNQTFTWLNGQPCFHVFQISISVGNSGNGNHNAETQVVDKIYNNFAAKKMGIEYKGQVCVMIHCRSRGLGHQVATGKYHTSQVHRDIVLVRFQLPRIYVFIIYESSSAIRLLVLFQYRIFF